jgi:hypothetical protein
VDPDCLHPAAAAAAAQGDKSKVINPCGLIAWSNFNDTYTIQRKAADEASFSEVKIRDKGIALPSDVRHRFGSQKGENFNPFINASRGGDNLTNDLGQEIELRQDERLIVWMRTAALPHFRKLWGIIDTDLAAGDTLTITVNNRCVGDNNTCKTCDASQPY